VLKGVTHDLGTGLAATLAGLIGAAFFLPGHIQQPGLPGPPRPGPSPQPRPAVTLSVYNKAPEYSWSLARALEAWNSSGASIHFYTVATANANVTVTISNPSTCGSDPNIAGCTELGHDGPRIIWIVQQFDKYDEAEVIVHELGHIIGLTHDFSGTCEAMTPDLGQNCSSPPPGEWRCRLLGPNDIKRAVGLVGGEARFPSGPEFCPKES